MNAEETFIQAFGTRDEAEQARKDYAALLCAESGTPPRGLGIRVRRWRATGWAVWLVRSGRADD